MTTTPQALADNQSSEAAQYANDANPLFSISSPSEKPDRPEKQPPVESTFRRQCASDAGLATMSSVALASMAKLERLLDSPVPEPIPPARWKTKMEAVLRGQYVQMPLLLCSLYALFFNGIRLMAVPKSGDTACYVLSLIVIVVFATEIVASVLCKEDYIISTFFAFDVLCTVSLIYDIGWIVPDGALSPEMDYGVSFRLIRALGMFRLVRILQLWWLTHSYEKTASESKDRERIEVNRQLNKRISDTQLFRREAILDLQKSRALRATFSTVDSAKIAKQSKIGRRIDGSTIRLVFVMIIPAMIATRIFIPEQYYSPYTSIKYSVKSLDETHAGMSADEFTAQCNNIIRFHRDDQYPLVSLVGPGCSSYFSSDTREDDLRDMEKEVETEGSYRGVIDRRPYTRICGALNLCRMIFACIVLLVSTMIGLYHNQRAIVVPIETMIEKANILSMSPMVFLNLDSTELGVYHNIANANELKRKNKTNTRDVVYLENAFNKIARLLAIVYGEAGSVMISRNTNTQDGLNPMIPGNKMYAIFGFIKISAYEEITSVLQEKILVFTNMVAEVIHATVEKYFGCTNKNIGESFFVLWKFRSEDVEESDGTVIAKTYASSVLADLSLFAYLKIIAKMNKLKHILDMKQEIEKQLEGQQVDFLFGLNVGWGIEGPIGSLHKIDASYLSPNVNIAARAESAASQYGKNILITGPVYNILSKQTRALCREVDTVALKGSKMPVRLFTVDLEFSQLAKKQCKYISHNNSERLRLRKQAKKVFHQMVKSGSTAPNMLYSEDKDIQAMRAGISPTFLKLFKGAYDNYIAGKWESAVDGLNEVLKIKPDDGPSQNLKQYMGSLGNKAPEEWRGCRELVNK
ncbi:MAG: adenylate/guanylate cyclase domain-containing protein [Candidatus Pacebacteria bacterium]|nr:adenylate/guanylate cyclase domain-containing protein [Candidatus Paceibacterota bacterium]